jgi:hypothetical protein
MTHDRGTVALTMAVLLTAVVFGPLVPAVDLPRDARDGEPLYGGFADEAGVGVDHRLSYRVVAAPQTATLADGVLTTPPTTVAVAAGDAPVTLRYQLQVDDRSTERTVVVPAGEARTITRTLELETDAPTNTTLRVVAITADATYTVHEEQLNLTDE